MFNMDIRYKLIFAVLLSIVVGKDENLGRLEETKQILLDVIDFLDHEQQTREVVEKHCSRGFPVRVIFSSFLSCRPQRWR